MLQTADMEFRRAVPSDIAAIMAIERMPGFERLVGRSTREEHAEAIENPSVRYLLLSYRAEPIGFVILERVGAKDGRVHLKRVAVREPGHGIGGQLLAETINWVFRNTDAERLDLDVFVDNARARAAYLKAGFQLEGRLRAYHRSLDGTIFDAWMMSILRHDLHG